MSRAVIVVGHELSFSEKAEDYRYYLKARAGIRSIKVLPGWNKTDDLLLGLVANQAFMAGRQPLLIVYIGHGAETGWGYGKFNAGKWMELAYARIADMLAVSRRGPTLLVNDCCYAEGLARAIVDRIPNDDGYSVISASAENGWSYGMMGDDVLASWSAAKPYEPRVRSVGRGKRRVRESRRGAVLDHHFFPAKP